MVPNEWKTKTLPEISWFQEGPGLRKWQFTEDGCKVINITNIVNGYLDLTKTERHISDEELKEKYQHFLCDAGDIVLASSGNSYCKHGIIREQDLPLVMNTSVIRFKPLENCDYEFLNQFLKSFYLKQQIDILITGGAQPNFGPAHLKQVKLAVPPLPEQRKIAKILSTWDKAISTTERLIENSKQQKKALMQQLLTGKKRLLDDSGKPFESEWEDLHLADIASIKKGKALSAKNVISGKYPVIAGGKTSPYSHNKYTHENIITVSASGAYAGYVSHHECKIWASDCSVVTEKKDNCLLFIFQLLKLNQNKIYSMQSGGAQPHIYPKDLQVLKVKKPNLDEQQKIASVLTNADQEIELLEQQLADLKQEKKALMQQLLTGKRRVKI